MTSIEQQSEIDRLISQCGEPVVHENIQLGSRAFWERQTSNRSREVCMVIQRTNGRLLTFHKTFYPAGVYRLFTGGVEFHETVLEALTREVYEETGLQFATSRLLAVIEYKAEDDPKGIQVATRFTTFAFLLEAEPGSVPVAMDEHEQIAAYSETTLEGLNTIAEQLDALPDSYSEELNESWQDWGRFRAVVHRAVHRAMIVLDNG